MTECADRALRDRARRFLSGLSRDELQFIAEFLCFCSLRSEDCNCSAWELAARLADFQRAEFGRAAADQDHKMIVLVEYLNQSGLERPAAFARGAGA